MSGVANTGMSCICDTNARIAAVARGQGGHVTRAQLDAAGLPRGAVDARVESGWLIRVHQGVYAVGHLPTNPLDRARGALLAAGPRSALRERSAAAYWGLYSRWPQPLELISPLRRRIPGLRISVCRSLLRRDIRAIDGIRVTSPARTLLDIAPQTYTKTLHRFHNELRMRRLVDNERLIDVAERNPCHPGSKLLLALAGASVGEAKRSPFEVDWVPFAARHKLPAYEMNIRVAGERIDVLFTPDRLIVELDGWGTHGSKRAFEDDRDQDSSILAATGIPTMRITYDGLHRRPREQVRRINAILARR
ncbi:MAG: type IV toxin-antitoxin system AbiEi family antitoxin domain-containing protein [Acidobacteriota bacterium]|nr:type IV toxin-antitoxin system AbiEi family antitoxin domain-containing protein [Acidobacteriota bacterium]